MSKTARRKDDPSLERAGQTELADQDLDQVKGGTFVRGQIPKELENATATSVWVREVVEDVEAY